LELQSDEAETVMSGSVPSETTSTTVIEFLDETPGSSWSVASSNCTNLMDVQPDVDLSKYLSRPVLIKTHVWSQTDTFSTTTTWDPWHLFFNSTPIKNKLNNYGFINCTLKLKFVINASPFYSGAMAFTYCPLQNLNGNSIVSDGVGGELIPHSQRAKVWIFPQTCEGGELKLPFFYHKNWLNITSAQDCRDMGTITPCLYSPLVSANGVSGTSVVVNVYAWAEDVKLHAPTTKLALQSDEFDYKPSQVASSVAAASSMLSRIPLIGPYMRATSIAASGMSKAAASLGFTNVPNIKTVDAVKIQPFPHNSSCEISVPMDRSAVDPKNEVSIDPRTVGLDGQDELDISYIAGRESYIGSAILSSTDSVDALTLVSRVTPMLAFWRGLAASPTQFTPMSYAAFPFKWWRGDIIFRFKFICTRFHKGRVRITFDPINDISASTPDYTTVFNEVVDIGADQDIEIRVPYSQATTFLELGTTSGNYNLTGSPVTPNQYCNGLVTMRVVNPLSGPQASVAIPVLVFARAAENIEFAHPTAMSSESTEWTPYTLQSGEVTYSVAPRQVIVGNKASTPDPNRYLVHYGERVQTFRPLLHRYAHQYTNETFGVVSTNTFTSLTHRTSRRFKYPGYDSSAYWSASKTLSAGNVPYSYVRMTVHNWISLLFIGQRGSINHMYNIECYNTQPPSRVTLQRHDVNVTAAEWAGTVASATASVNVISQLYRTNIREYNNGTALTDFRQTPGITMNFPYYSPYNFQFVNPSNATLGSSVDKTDVDNVATQIMYYKVPSNASCRIHAHYAYGPDYNFFYFNNAPSLWSYTTPNGA
jgi:hypothetical protein